MPAEPLHSCQVLATPWPAVYATDIESGRHYGKHWHATFGLGLIDDGAHRSSSGRGSVEAFAGDIVTTNPGEVHDGRPLGTPVRRWRTVYIEPEVIASLALEADSPADVVFEAAAFRDEPLRRDVLALLDAMARWTRQPATAAASLACEEALVRACTRMLHAHAGLRDREGQASADAMPVVLERLADEGLPAPSLAELARLAGLGRFQLLRRFSRAHGTSPHAWWLQHRAERARSLIARGTAIADAAAQAGFADQPHLTRVFVRRYGFTPGAWQAAVAPQERSRRLGAA